ncbi:hypothetical protein MRX96_017772 [Rhipicephalus microplus]
MQYPSWLAIPTYRRIPLVTTKTICGIEAQVRSLLAAKQQECSTLRHEQLIGRLLVYANGSVLRDGSAAATCVVPSVCAVPKCRLPSLASSTVAELAAINLAADFLSERAPMSAAAIICDSRMALAAISHEEDGSLLAQKVARKLHLGLEYQPVDSLPLYVTAVADGEDQACGSHCRATGASIIENTVR